MLLALIVTYGGSYLRTIIFEFHLSESSSQQCFNDEMHVVFASAITNFVIFL